mgnify:FL=1|jgi:hypothetical protein
MPFVKNPITGKWSTKQRLKALELLHKSNKLTDKEHTQISKMIQKVISGE